MQSDDPSSSGVDASLLLGVERLRESQGDATDRQLEQLFLLLLGPLVAANDVRARAFTRFIDTLAFTLAEMADHEAPLTPAVTARINGRAHQLARAARERLQIGGDLSYDPERNRFLTLVDGKPTPQGAALFNTLALYFAGERNRAMSIGLTAVSEVFAEMAKH
jgi:hypothetical protein